MRYNRFLIVLSLILVLGGVVACTEQTLIEGDELAPVSTATVSAPASATPAPATNLPPTATSTVATPATETPTLPVPQPVEEEAMPDPSAIPGTVEPGLEALIRLAQDDLAQRLSIPVEQIEVVEARSVVWPDSSLGCPQPGMEYLQVPQDGSLIRLAVDGRVYEYHGGGGRAPFLCQQPLKIEKDTPPLLDLFQLTPDSPDD